MLNIEETKEFTISIVTKDIVEQVSLSSCEFKRDVDSFGNSIPVNYRASILERIFGEIIKTEEEE